MNLTLGFNRHMNPVMSTHFVDESIDGLLEGLPSQPLVGHTALVLNLRL